MPRSQRYSLAEQMKNQIRENRESGSSSTAGKHALFSEMPVSLNEFIHGPDYLNKPDLNLSPLQYDLVRHMEQI